jgi:hypothetical protein
MGISTMPSGHALLISFAIVAGAADDLFFAGREVRELLPTLSIRSHGRITGESPSRRSPRLRRLRGFSKTRCWTQHGLRRDTAAVPGLVMSKSRSIEGFLQAVVAEFQISSRQERRCVRLSRAAVPCRRCDNSSPHRSIPEHRPGTVYPSSEDKLGRQAFSKESISLNVPPAVLMLEAKVCPADYDGGDGGCCDLQHWPDYPVRPGFINRMPLRVRRGPGNWALWSLAAHLPSRPV